MATRLQVIGGGKMGEALLGGLVADGWATPGELHVVEPDEDRRRVLAEAVAGISCGAAPGAWAGTAPTW